jgi:sn-glycerol 3-phosphate transport system substrate-binding protein
MGRSVRRAVTLVVVALAAASACSLGDDAGIGPGPSTELGAPDSPDDRDTPDDPDGLDDPDSLDDPDGPDDRDTPGADDAAPASNADEPLCLPLDRATDDPEPATVTLWHSFGGDQIYEAFDALVREFDDAHPHITIETIRVEGYVNALRMLRETDPADFPDLFMSSVDNARLLAESGVFVPPGACWGRDPEVLDDLLPVIRESITVDGTLWSYPTNISTPVLLYDRSLLVDVGFDPDEQPATAADLADMVTAITAAGVAPGGLALYDRSASWLVEQWAVHHGHVLVEPDNGVDGHPVDAVRFATDEAVAALEWARDLYDAGLVTWVGANQSGIDDLLRLIDLNDRAAFTLHTSAVLGDIVWLLYDTGLDDLEGAVLGVAPLPTAVARPAPAPASDPASGAGSLVGGGTLWLLDNDDPVATGAAARFAEFLMEPVNQASLAATTGYVPATRAAAEHPITVARWEELPEFAVPYRQLAERSTTPAEIGMQVAPRVAVQRVLEEAAADVVVGGADARPRLEEAERQALAVIRAYERDGETARDR